MSIQSVRFCRPLGSLVPSALVPLLMRRAALPFCLLVSPYRLVSHRLALRPVVRVDRRGAISCLPRLPHSFPWIACRACSMPHERRDEMMDEMMSRPLLAFFLLFLSPYPLLPVLVDLLT